MLQNTKKILLADIYVFSVTVICILINYLGKEVAIRAELPLWLDCVGTAICAYIYGPVCGAIVGVTANLMYGLQEPIVLMYAVVNAWTGLIVGLTAKKRMIDSFFEASKVAALLTVVSTVVSTPLNIWINEGLVENKWGDAIVIYLKHHGIHRILASTIGEFFVDFADKLLTLTILFLLVKTVRAIRKKGKKNQNQNIGPALMLGFISMLSAILMATDTAAAQTKMNETEEVDYSSYIQTIYNNTNGLSCGEANDIVATNDGVLWIGTYAGLYRYNGSQFQYMDDYSSIKNVNDLYVDEEGRLWVGTNDMGISICSREEVSNILDTRNGLPSNSVRSIVRNSDGDYMVGTSSSLAVVSLSGGIRTKEIIDEIQYAKSLSSDLSGHTAAVTAQGELFLLEGTTVKTCIVSDHEKYTSCRYDKGGRLYVTTDVGRLYVYETVGGTLVQRDIIFCSELTALNNTYEMEDGTVFVCSDSGVCYIDERNKPHLLATGAFSSSIDNMTVDYQGNIWFSSSRQGLLKLCPSAFSDLYTIAGVDEKVVNSVTVWHNKIYCGTDSGLDVIHKNTNGVVSERIAKELVGERIRNVFVDSKDRLWICSSIGDVIRVEKDGTRIRHIGEAEGVVGTKFRQALELQDGTVAVASEMGVSVIDDMRVVYTIDRKSGLNNSIVLCMHQRADGSLLVGTDGGGIAVVRDGQVTHAYSSNELGSGVILRIVKDRDNENVFIVTSNGLCYMTEKNEIRQLSNFPYSNNFDIYDNGNGVLFVTGSAGIYVVNKEELLAGGMLHYEQLNYINGLRQTITANSWNYVDKDQTWFICNNAGVTKLDLNEYQQGVRSFRLIINTMKIDDVTHVVDRSEDIVLSGENVILTLKPEIINYTAEDPIVRYYMEGYDKDPIDVRQSELREVEYRGLPAGTFQFHLAVLDKYNHVAEKQIYTIVRKQELYETKAFRVYFIVELIALIAWIAWVVTRIYMGKALESKNREVEHALEQVRLGNETILTIAKTVDAKDENTSQHSIRVSEYSLMIGKKLGYDDEECENLRKSALLHDIGKIGIPDSVLNKKGRLNDEEYEIMKSHVTRGGEILKNFTFIPHVQEGAMYHHERYDGKGYANGLKGEEIPEFARIIGVADAFDAMTANRVYRKQLEIGVVLDELRKGRGTQFDPRMTDIMLGLIKDGEIDIEQLYQSSQKEGDNE